jgi:hypothetical protein
MKNWSVIIGCLILSIGIVIAGFSISNAIQQQTFVNTIPGSIDVNTGQAASFGDYLNEGEAMEYLRMLPEVFGEYLQSGKLDGTFIRTSATKTDGGEVVAFGEPLIFSKAKLDALLISLIESSN